MNKPESIPEDKLESYPCTDKDCPGNLVKNKDLNWECDVCDVMYFASSGYQS